MDLPGPAWNLATYLVSSSMNKLALVGSWNICLIRDQCKACWEWREKWKKVKVKSLSQVQLFATPWTVACQAPPSVGFSRQEYCSGLPFPFPGYLPNLGSDPRLLHCRQILYHLSHQGEPPYCIIVGPESSHWCWYKDTMWAHREEEAVWLQRQIGVMLP